MSAKTALQRADELWEVVLAKYKQSESTNEETARRAFLDHIRIMVVEWGTLPDKTVKERLEGLAFCFCSLLDGSHLGMPGYQVRAVRAKEDGQPLPLGPDISGGLHDQFYPTQPWPNE